MVLLIAAVVAERPVLTDKKINREPGLPGLTHFLPDMYSDAEQAQPFDDITGKQRNN